MPPPTPDIPAFQATGSSMETHPASGTLPFGCNVLAPGFPLKVLYFICHTWSWCLPSHSVLGSQVNYQHTFLQASLLGWALERGRAASTVSNSKYVVSFSLTLIKTDLKASGRVIHTLYKAFLKQKNETSGISHDLKNYVKSWSKSHCFKFKKLVHILRLRTF